MNASFSLAAEVRGLIQRMLEPGTPDAQTIAAACECVVLAIDRGHSCVPLSVLAGRNRAQILKLGSEDETALPETAGTAPDPSASTSADDASDAADSTADTDPAFPSADELAAILRSARAVVCDVASGTDPESSPAPFVLASGRLYTRRNYKCERHIKASLGKMLDNHVAEPEPSDGAPELSGLTEEQCKAVKVLLSKPFSILSGGPGTGKTYTLARAVRCALSTNPTLRLRLAAPTGKAAARMKESLLKACQDPGAIMPQNVGAETLHRLLGANPSTGRFAADREHPLAADWVVVDETSMVDLLLFGHLLDALPAGARLTLIGDRDQLASVERGCVLRDLCDAGFPVAWLTESKRFPSEGVIAKFAAAVNGGREDDAVGILKSGDADLVWHEFADANGDVGPKKWPEFAAAVKQGFSKFAETRSPEDALKHVSDARVLCAVRKGPYGVDRANEFVRSVLADSAPIPVMVSKNDRDQKVCNGDVGVIMPDDTENVWFEGVVSGDPPRSIPRLLLPDLEVAYATTVHKSQGSEFGTVAVVLPRKSDCPLLTREILYTAVTRTVKGVRLWASEASVRRCVKNNVERFSGLASG